MGTPMIVEQPLTERPDALQVLLEASFLLLKAASEGESVAQILDLASSLLGADAYAVWREFDEARTWRIISKRGLSDRYPQRDARRSNGAYLRLDSRRRPHR